MPDWTYHPLRPVANAVVGERRAQTGALRFLSVLIGLPGGGAAIRRVFDHPEVPPDWVGRFGAAVPVSVARDAVRVLPVQGASIVEIGPVAAGDVDLVRQAARGRACRVVARVADPAVGALLGNVVDDVVVGDPADRVYLRELDIANAVAALRDPAVTVLAEPTVLVAAGPSWFQRVIEAAEVTEPAAPGLRDAGIDLRTPPG
ncbi:hypothetical protein [Nocardia sp. IFM 10818]